MTPEERVRVVVALDHDSRQPQTTLAMSMRNLRILVNDLDANTTVKALRKSLPRSRPSSSRCKRRCARSSTFSKT